MAVSVQLKSPNVLRAHKHRVHLFNEQFFVENMYVQPKRFELSVRRNECRHGIVHTRCNVALEMEGFQRRGKHLHEFVHPSGVPNGYSMEFVESTKVGDRIELKTLKTIELEVSQAVHLREGGTYEVAPNEGET